MYPVSAVLTLSADVNQRKHMSELENKKEKTGSTV
jgi:hypothetical protein